ncbi:hypothetical protein [Anaeromyxobacter soli]|uniref:hypothetical protein n=1 Tax=Anaeromyxobacter soli TaxID=2922725 RepID=UPI001FB03BA0|nr:hypothetical protein [Anaeromyxobacter sp. SG29]
MRGVSLPLVLVLGLALAACAPALRKPAVLPPATRGAGAAAAARLLADADAAFGRRPDPAAVRRAEALYREAAQADPGAVEGPYGAARAVIWLAEHERSAAERARLATSAVELGQLCEARAPEEARCAYALALGLGIQARERRSTAAEGLKLMVERLRRAAARDPALDEAGPERVLALLLLRAPGWPLGPGDPEAGLAEAKKAASRAPEFPPNLLALAEALAANGDPAAGRAAAGRALALAERRAAAGEPDAPEWVVEARRLLAAPAQAPDAREPRSESSSAGRNIG